ncbi:MAG TPA: MBL fold metallo-hydrolase [Edaphocola sp.]|nr:MBL fold metallo-hydrolase [Edaphocola sp.]
MLKITFLGTGTSQGIPLIGCHCPVCQSKDKKNNRLRSSVWIRNEDTSIVIDTGPDFRYQMLRAEVAQVDGILFTHGHKDHVAGLDDVRAFNYWSHKDMELYANEETEKVIRREFHYAFSGDNYPGIPKLNIHPLHGQDIYIGSLIIETIKVLHYRMEVYGYRIGDFTYITDANYISPEEKEKIKGSKILVLNALRFEPHISHFTFDEAIALAQEVGAEQTYLTHLSHQAGLHEVISKRLPSNVHIAYDQLTLQL